jgi:hypothetical protein
MARALFVGVMLIALLVPLSARAAGRSFLEVDTRAVWVPRPMPLSLYNDDDRVDGVPDDFVPSVGSMQAFGLHLAFGARPWRHVAIPILGFTVAGAQGGYRAVARDGLAFRPDGGMVYVAFEPVGFRLETTSGGWTLSLALIPGLHGTALGGKLRNADGESDVSGQSLGLFIRGEGRIAWHQPDSYGFYVFGSPTLVDSRGAMNGGVIGLGVEWNP